MRVFLLLFFGFFGITGYAQNAGTEDLLDIQVDVVYLASDLLEGREAGKRGERMAARYISARMAEIGLEPKGSKGFYQSFPFEATDPHATPDRNNPHARPKGEKRTGQNVVGYLDNKAKTTVVIGGHYDHLGFAHSGSRHVGPPAIHNGADDNASGIAALLYLAEKLKTEGPKRHNYLFIAFSAEEMGLYGSKYYVANPTIDLDKVSYMLNMDMIGRLNPAKVLAVNGIGTSPSWEAALARNKTASLTTKTTKSGIGPSDHTSFYLAKIPVLHFFSGQHTDYHKPGDDSHLVNYQGILDIANFMYALIEDVSKERKLAYTETQDDNAGRAAASFKVTLGVMPDYVHDGEGMRIDAVLPGRVAAKAGLQNGDVLIKIGDRDVKDIYDYMEGLADFEAGQTTTVVVNRKGKEVKAEVTF